MTHRGPFQPLTFCDSVTISLAHIWVCLLWFSVHWQYEALMVACTVCDVPDFLLGALITLSLQQTLPVLQLFSSFTTLHNVTFYPR